jgi:hypothetical protein
LYACFLKWNSLKLKRDLHTGRRLIPAKPFTLNSLICAHSHVY